MPGAGRQLAATTLRFVLLLTLLLVASVWMARFTMANLGLLRPAGVTCDGMIPTDNRRQITYDPTKCVEWQAVTPPWWVLPAASLLLLAAAAVMFAVLPRWQARRGRMLPLAVVDRDGQAGRMIAELVAQTGLRRVPTVLVDPTAMSASAVVFGRTGRPRLCLHGGLLVRLRTDPHAVRAVLLHELAHIDNRDVTLTYATVTLWRSFIVVALAPFVATHLHLVVSSPFHPGAVPTHRNLLAAALLVTLVYLSRADLLRTREFHADLAAARWGADLRGWPAPPPVPTGRGRRLWAGLGGLWRTHPDWASRRRVLADPDLLSRIPALAMFLTGAVLILADAQLFWIDPAALASAVEPTLAVAAEPTLAVAVAVALLVTGVISSLVWQAVESARRTGHGGPEGLRAGWWLGLGMLVAEFVSGRVAIWEWLPQQPVLLVLLLLAGTTLTWWITQCCHLWASAWPGRSLRPARWVVFVTGFVAIVGWMTWWRLQGIVLAHGVPLLRDQFALVVAPGGLDAGQLLPHETVLPAYLTMTWLTTMMVLHAAPLSQIAVAASWAFPLAAWLVRPRPAPSPGPASDPGAGTEAAGPPVPVVPPPPLPRLRRLVLPALVGTLLCWAAVATVMALMRLALPVTEIRARTFVTAYQGWVTFALLGAVALSALVASTIAGRHHLVAAVVAGHLTMLGGTVGVLVLVAIDGCVGSLTLFHASCGWQPGQAWTAWRALLDEILVAALVTTISTAGLVAGTRAVTARWRRGRPATVDVPGRARMVARRAVVTVAVSTALALTIAYEATAPAVEGTTARPGPSSSHPPAGGAQPTDGAPPADGVAPTAEPTGSPSSPRLKAVEVSAWIGRGGGSVTTRFHTVYGTFAVAIGDLKAQKPSANGKVEVDEARIRPLCATIEAIAQDAARLAAVPDEPAQARWEAFVDHVARAGRGCSRAFEIGDSQPFIAAINDLQLAHTHLTAVTERIAEIHKAGEG
ncbi:M48 family metalloprotease [Micromonospora fluostatini]|uniref:M48 family metalloprotease n=1 Tax=Micromonospora sp. JCM 30529 TaxID=3421643 RepID=UPI003D16D0BE